jgi:lipid-binding SYLF domain-containing protein
MGFSGKLCAVISIFALLGIPLQDGIAGTAEEIDLKVDEALVRFKKENAVAESVLAASKGILVFPNVIKAGIGIGGEIGEGALRVSGETVEYYTTMAASIGFQLGAQSKAVFLVFMQEEALKEFRASSGWKAGVDGSVALINIGAGASFDTTQIEEPIVGFVMTNAGLMYNATLEGSKYTKVVR